ncbi:hypothetical protein Pcinc_020123 [Petrolisthes cinctipes]|uniref:Uncharacterized protein n=1 Tax=Petrolisthes cinctipes TaxID=88211 RepID=A0AAE1KK75_PETCI|nr:hypothetical protein Pcinc_020123 [Petrolisthes cinctipes]
MISTGVIILLTLLVSVKSEGVDRDRWRGTSIASHTDYNNNNNNNNNKPSSISPSNSPSFSSPSSYYSLSPSSSYYSLSPSSYDSLSPSSSSNSPSPSPYYSLSNSASSSSPLPSSCRLGYSVKQYYPTEKKIYQQLTCYACYTFIPTHRRNHTLHIEDRYVKLSDGAQYQVKMFKIEDKMYPFDPDEVEAWKHVRASMSNSLEADKLEDCCWEAVQCCREKLNDDDPIDDDNNNNNNNNDDEEDNNKTSSSSHQCPRTWDGWSCIPPTPAHTTLTITCPHHAYTVIPRMHIDGPDEMYRRGQSYHLVNYHWEAVTHLISILALIPAVIILLVYRQLRVQRFYLHLSPLVGSDGGSSVYYSRYLDHQGFRVQAPVTCRKVFGVAVWWCMLAQSIYLHRLIVAAFKGGGKTWMYIVLGWVPSVIIVSVWVVCRALLENYQCWLGDDHSTSADLFLITEVPKFIILIINTVLLGNMTRVLMTKLRGVSGNQSNASRRAVKATAFLLPMFGLQFFLPLYVPPSTISCQAMQVYFFFATLVDGLQGLYVATVYCFINKEVKLQVRRSLHRLKGRWTTTDYPTTSTAWDPHTNVSVLSTSSHYQPQHQQHSSVPEEIPLTTTTTTTATTT